MTGPEMINLIEVGAADRLRKKLKKYGIEERMRKLNECIPYISTSLRVVNFFSDNFKFEVGALVLCERDVMKAVDIYRSVNK